MEIRQDQSQFFEYFACQNFGTSNRNKDVLTIYSVNSGKLTTGTLLKEIKPKFIQTLKPQNEEMSISFALFAKLKYQSSEKVNKSKTYEVKSPCEVEACYLRPQRKSEAGCDGGF